MEIGEENYGGRMETSNERNWNIKERKINNNISYNRVRLRLISS